MFNVTVYQFTYSFSVYMASLKSGDSVSEREVCFWKYLTLCTKFLFKTAFSFPS